MLGGAGAGMAAGIGIGNGGSSGSMAGENKGTANGGAGGGGGSAGATPTLAGLAAAGILYDEGELDPSFLQRSISAPPTDHAFHAGAERGGGLDYYYYYQPNNLNPRLPNNGKQGELSPDSFTAADGQQHHPPQPPPQPGAPGLSRDDSGLFAHFPQPSKPVSAALVGEYLTGGLEGSGGGGPTSSSASMAPSVSNAPPSSHAAMGALEAPRPVRTPSLPPGAADSPLVPSPIGPSLHDAAKAKSLIQLIQDDFPRTPSPVFPHANGPASAASVAQAISLGMATAAAAAAAAHQQGSHPNSNVSSPARAYPGGPRSASVPLVASAHPPPLPPRGPTPTHQHHPGSGVSAAVSAAAAAAAASSVDMLASTMQGLGLGLPGGANGGGGSGAVDDLMLDAAGAHHHVGHHGGGPGHAMHQHGGSGLPPAYHPHHPGHVRAASANDIERHAAVAAAAARGHGHGHGYGGHGGHGGMYPGVHDPSAGDFAGLDAAGLLAGARAGGAGAQGGEAGEQVYFRMAQQQQQAQQAGPYGRMQQQQQQQEHVVYRVPAEYVASNGDIRLPPEYLNSVLSHGGVNVNLGGHAPVPAGPPHHHAHSLSWGGSSSAGTRHAAHAGGMGMNALPPHLARELAGQPAALSHTAAAAAARQGAGLAGGMYGGLTPEILAHGRLHQEAAERGYKLVPKDMPLGGDAHLRGKDPQYHRAGLGPQRPGLGPAHGGHHGLHAGHHPQAYGREGMGSMGREGRLGAPPSTLDEFRNNTKNRPWDIRDISGDIVEFCQDQHGSRFIQQKLEVATDEEKELIFKEILPRAHTLMTDVFGNYVIQKVLEHGTPEHRDVIASILTGHAVQLALQMYGCRVIQKALEVIGVQRLLALVSEFEGHVLKCVHDQNGNHVIQKCIEVLSLKTKEYPEYAQFLVPQIEFIVQAFVGQVNNVEKFSTHPYGCRVIQRILEHCTGAQKNAILDEIRKCSSTLIQDQYGNYVIQHVMKHGRPADRQMVINEVKARMLLYSQHKFASNVVEKCLQYGSKAERNDIIDEVVRSVMEKSSLLQVMVRDPYGNYVVQKILDIADDRQQEALCSYLRHHAAQLKRYTYGKHILVRLEKISGEKFV